MSRNINFEDPGKPLRKHAAGVTSFGSRPVDNFHIEFMIEDPVFAGSCAACGPTVVVSWSAVHTRPVIELAKGFIHLGALLDDSFHFPKFIHQVDFGVQPPCGVDDKTWG